MSGNYRSKVATNLLGKVEKDGEFDAYFKLYEELFGIGTGDQAIHIPSQQNRQPISHDSVMTAAGILRDNTRLTLAEMKAAINQALQHRHFPAEVDLVVRIAVRAMYMIDSNIKESHGPEYTIGGYRHASWLPDESLVDFITRSFPPVSVERRSRVAAVLEDKRFLKAWKLRDRLGIILRGTDNLADHLLFDPGNRILYLSHHAAYLKAHLDRCRHQFGDAAKDAGIASAIEKGTLSPRLLAETLHSLQSILFRYDDDKSMSCLNHLIKTRDFDKSCAIPEGYKIFQDVADDFPYTYWGERLSVIHDLVLDRPPRTRFERWIKWQTSESNSFFVAMLALVISIVVGLLSLGLSGFQAWVAWQAWKHPNNPPGGNSSSDVT